MTTGAVEPNGEDEWCGSAPQDEGVRAGVAGAALVPARSPSIHAAMPPIAELPHAGTRFLIAGVDGLLQDAPRPGRPRTARETSKVAEVVRITLEQTPAAATHWSTRTLAQHLGTSATAVARIWRDHGLKPHRVESFKLSNDPRFVEKLDDIVGLYLDPPELALVFCCDEKTQIQAIDCTQPGLPLKRGRGTTMTQDYTRKRCDDLVRRTQRTHGHGVVDDRSMPSASGVVEVSQDD